MIHEPTIGIECDECGHTEIIEPEYKYFDYSGERGEYDCSDEAVMRAVERMGWYCEDDRHLCDECKNA